MNDKRENLLIEGVLFDGRYRLIRSLSTEGGTADVWLALDTNTIDEVYDAQSDKVKAVEESGIKVAIKVYRPSNALDLGEQRFRDEFKIVFNCHHSNLVQPINFSIYQGIPYLVLPFCQNGSSEELKGMVQDKENLWKYIADVSGALEYLHAFNPVIVHHDVKPANILIDDKKNYVITDFGISSHRGINNEGYSEAHSGTLAYMAPERFKEGYESIPDSDIWSFGATLYELITGSVPFGEDGGLAQLEGAKMTTVNKRIPADIRRLIYDCLQLDSSKRPSAATIHKAAMAGRYPLRKSKKWLWFGPLLLIGIAAAIVLPITLGERHGSGNKSENSETVAGVEKKSEQGQNIAEEQKEPSEEEQFRTALDLMQTTDKARMEQGMEILDKLSKNDYIPALYELAYTYGWYADQESVDRKNVLGIEFEPNPVKESEKYLPRSMKINQTAMYYLNRIVDLNDESYPEINARAFYKLATYYNNTDKVVALNPALAYKLCSEALNWAELGGDTELYDKIKRNQENIIYNPSDE